MKKKITIAISLLIAVASIYLMFFKSYNGLNKPEYLFSTIKKGSVAKEITASGTINAFKIVEVGTQVSGIVSKIYVDYNDFVKKGQVIAMIDTIALAAYVTEEESNYLKANVQFLQQEKDYTRNKELLESKVIPQSEFDVINANYLSAKSTLKSAESQLSRAKINLNYASIKAPISGVVISRNVDVGQTVAASFSTPVLFTIANDLRRMQLQAKIDEADIGQIKINQPVKFAVDAFPDETFTGIVKQIRLQPVITQNVVNYNVMINVPNPQRKLLPGMTANLSIKVEEHNNVLLVPISAIFFNPDFVHQNNNSKLKTTIWIESTDKENSSHNANGISITPLTIKRGLDDGSFIEISSEIIKEGIKVITGIKEIEIIEKKKDLFDGPNNDPMED